MSILYPEAFILLFGLAFLVKKSRLLALSLAIMIVALSRPVLTQIRENEKLHGREFIIALDVSYSMRAEDIAPSRLEKAKMLIRRILKENPDDIFSLFAFTTNPLILCPATSDHQLLLSALDSLKVENILTHGTSLKKLFTRVNKLNMPEKNLLLLSDGGEERSVEKFDINIFSIIMASQKGSTLKDSSAKTIKDAKGNLIITKANPLLKEISTKTFYHDRLDFSLDFVEQQKLSQKEKLGYYELFWIPLLLSLLLFFIHYIKIPKRVLLLLPFLTLGADAGVLDWYYIGKAQAYYHDKAYKKAAESYEKIERKTMQSQMNLANAYYQGGLYNKARRVYKKLKTTNPHLKKVLLFKLGNCEAKLEAYSTAKAYYHEALLFGEDADIVYNLKLIENKKEDDKTPKKGGDDKEKREASTASAQSKKGKQGKSSSTPSKLSHPLGFKAYELINKGYIHEKRPW